MILQRLLSIFLITFILTACGADGEPERPSRSEAPSTGISISGTASIGISGSN